jgi:hypothetical protein
VERLLLLGAAGVIAKPFNPLMLAALVRHYPVNRHLRRRYADPAQFRTVAFLRKGDGVKPYSDDAVCITAV